MSAAALLAVCPSLWAQGLAPQAAGQPANVKSGLLQKIGIDQHLKQQVPLDLPFTDETGRDVRLGDFFGNLVEPILGKIREITKPLEPIVNFLNTRIPVVSDLMGRKIETAVDEVRLRPANSEVERLWADNSKAKRLLGWEPRYGDVEAFRLGGGALQT